MKFSKRIAIDGHYHDLEFTELKSFRNERTVMLVEGYGKPFLMNQTQDGSWVFFTSSPIGVISLQYDLSKSIRDAIEDAS